MACIRSLLLDDCGATAIEYGMILALVFLAMIAGVASLGQSLEDIFDMVAAEAGGAISQSAADFNESH